jgi:nitrite reductase/ring-hydroxylating ferredoxin subunit
VKTRFYKPLLSQTQRVPLRHGQVYCIDSLCYHAGGPLAVGDIEDVGGRPCLSCPWHLYKVTLDSGEKLYGATRFDDAGKLVPDGIKSVGQRQRVHEAGLYATS